jgi:small-conductance mechanosensitive channel
MNFKVYLDQVLNWLLTSGPKILLIIILAIVALKVTKVLSFRLLEAIKREKLKDEAEKRVATLSSLIRYILSVSILLMAVMMILGELGIEIGPILAAAGIVGLAVGFGAQHLVQDVISGFFIVMQDQVRVGDVVSVSGKCGLVEKVNLKNIVLRDLSGNVHYVRNGLIEIVTNMTKDYSQYVFEIGVAYREDVDEVMQVIKEVDEDLRRDENYGKDILAPIDVMGLDKFADSALIIKARTKTKPIKQWRVAREFNRRLKKRFDELNIEIPFPHTTVYMGQGKKGEAPPINVSVLRPDAG